MSYNEIGISSIGGNDFDEISGNFINNNTKEGIFLDSAYENEICNNFKDKGVSNFTGELFDKLRDEISDIFDNMPPPKRTERTTSFKEWYRCL